MWRRWEIAPTSEDLQTSLTTGLAYLWFVVLDSSDRRGINQRPPLKCLAARPKRCRAASLLNGAFELSRHRSVSVAAFFRQPVSCLHRHLMILPPLLRQVTTSACQKCTPISVEAVSPPTNFATAKFVPIHVHDTRHWLSQNFVYRVSSIVYRATFSAILLHVKSFDAIRVS